jgi:hypothetical protein
MIKSRIPQKDDVRQTTTIPPIPIRRAQKEQESLVSASYTSIIPPCQCNGMDNKYAAKAPQTPRVSLPCFRR